MLNLSKLYEEFLQQKDTLFIDLTSERARARTYWERIIADTALQKKIPFVQSAGSLPTWEVLDAIHTIPACTQYQVLAVDGSQIYPDRHQGVSCYLINIGTAYCAYGTHSSAQFSSTPSIASSITEWGELPPEVIDCIRTEHELRTGLIQSRRYIKNAAPFIFMVDGSIIFWHLDSKDEATKQRFLTSYITIFQQLCDERILHAGIISLPKSRELVHIIDAATKIWGKDDAFMHLVDTDIVEFFVKPGERTGAFKNNSVITALYPADLQPYFFYMNTGYEILRIEVPAWIARDTTLVNSMASTVYDQTKKGYGYPVCLAESHEQAVVKAADREYFYALLQKTAHAANRKYVLSQKSAKKRVMSY